MSARSAHYADQPLKAAGVNGTARRNLVCLVFLHDIGAYKTEEIAKMVQFEMETCWDHSIYSMLFLHHYSPFSALSEAVLYHHSRWDRLLGSRRQPRYCLAANFISFCDRLDIFITFHKAIRPQVSSARPNRGTRALCAGADRAGGRRRFTSWLTPRPISYFSWNNKFRFSLNRSRFC